MGFKKREKILIFAAIISISILFGDKLLVSPLIRLWKTRSERITYLRQSLENGSFIVDRADAIQGVWQELKKRSLAQKKANAENQILNSVNDWARNSGINVVSLKPRWVENGEQSMLLEFRLSAIGDVRSLARFLFEIESDPLALKLEDVEITSRDARGTELDLAARFSGLIIVDKES